VIEGANSQPYSHLHRPGVAVGGHCIPVYPLLYLSTDPTATMPLAGRRANAAMPSYACGVLNDLLGGLAGSTIVILGAAYRGDVKETAFSGVFPLETELSELGAKVLVHDPLYTPDEIRALDLNAYSYGEACDGAILQADHGQYADLTVSDLPGIKAIIDGRDTLDPVRWPGVLVKSLGRPLRTG
jgi:UDP-N-acetyl-D-mannosaminuronate dehydrogenase